MPLAHLTDLLDSIASRGGRTAFVWRRRYRSERCTYRDLAAAAGSAAGRLAAAGVAPGDRVLVRGPNSPQWVATFLGGLRLGAVLVPVDPTADPAFVERVARRAGCRAAVLPGADPAVVAVPRLALESIGGAGAPPPPPVHRAVPSETLQLVFTSGSTGEPRGVVITHGNVLAYLQPIARGYERRRWWVAPLLPVPVLCLPPLGHLFGQAVGIFSPLLLGCTVVFAEALDAAALRRTVRDERVWVVMAVPRLLEMLADDLRRDAARRRIDLDALLAAAPGRGFAARAWAARRVQGRLGWRCRAFIVGGAPLDPDLERFWRALGYVVVQGYGLTETAPIVTLTHPFRPREGAVGRPLGGQELRLAEDGEILVRGRNVMTGYWDDLESTREAIDPDGWLHTGDLGRLEPDGTLRIVGRKKEVIVTAEGLNVHPEDVEHALCREPRIRDAVVLGRKGERGEEVWAVLLLDAGADPAEAVASANRALSAHQRIRGFTVWPGDDFPRTPTLKPRRREVAALLAAPPPPGKAGTGARPAGGAGGGAPGQVNDPLARLLARAGADPARLTDDARLADLGLSSLDLVELAASVESEFDVPVEDAAVGGEVSVADLRRLVAEGSPRAGAAGEVPIPRWGASWPARLVGAVVREALVHPAMAVLAPLRVEGREHLAGVQPPVLFVANHVSLLDTPVLARALPARFRLRLAPAIRAAQFHAWFRPGPGAAGGRWSRGVQYLLSALLYQAFPLPQGEGFRRALEHAGLLADRGLCPLVFPEGTRTAGRILPFQAGVGLFALRLGIPVIPLHHDGLARVLPPDARRPHRAPVRVRIGPPVPLGGTADPAAAAAAIEAAVRGLGSAEA